MTLLAKVCNKATTLTRWGFDPAARSKLEFIPIPLESSNKNSHNPLNTKILANNSQVGRHGLCSNLEPKLFRPS